MAEQGPNSLLILFRQWRGGDAAAGNEMAQRFSDWYYTLAVSRLGDQQARDPLKKACDRFAQEIPNVTNPNQLVSWAYKVIREEIDRAGSRLVEADIPNGFSKNQSPRALLADARKAMPAHRITLLAHAYDATYPLDALIKECEERGGFPLAILQARQELKQWLAQEKGLPLKSISTIPNLDWAPLPLYEAARMSTNTEEARFERWMLTQYDLCRDVSEFATFALALRGGALKGALEPAKTTAPVKAADKSAKAEPAPTSAEPHPILKYIIVGAIVLLVLVLGAILVLTFLNRSGAA